MRLGLVAALVLLGLPTAAAQAPDPGDVVLLLCETAGGIEAQARDALPVCPREEPAAPAPAAEEAAAPPPPAAPAAPEQAAALVDEAVATGEGIVEDPPSAGDRLLAFVAGVIAFVKELLQLPIVAAAAVGDAIASAVDAVKGAAAATGDAIASAADAARQAIASLFDRPDDAPLPVAKPDVALPGRPSLELPLGKIGEMLPEG